MSGWTCGLEGCDARFRAAEEAVIHQARDHPRRECRVCGAVVPAGYFGIRHAFGEHSRAEFVRSYDADAAAVRERESVRDAVEAAVDVDRVAEALDADPAELGLQSV